MLLQMMLSALVKYLAANPAAVEDLVAQGVTAATAALKAHNAAPVVAAVP